MTDVMLPPQWAQWLNSLGFTIYPRSDHLTHWMGHGRHWRINTYGEFQTSEAFDTFDRWVNSTAYTSEGIPQTLEDFKGRVNRHLARLERRDRLINYLQRSKLT